jgi:hypothetical protein
MLHQILRFFRLSPRLLGSAILALSVAASPARAQLGGLVKKAKDAAVKKAADESGARSASTSSRTRTARNSPTSSASVSRSATAGARS